MKIGIVLTIGFGVVDICFLRMLRGLWGSGMEAELSSEGGL